MSFRSKVLDALNIEKKTVKLQVNEIFPPVYDEDAAPSDTGVITGRPTSYTRNQHVPYVVSKEIINSKIGVNVGGGGTVQQKLDVLGFVVGKPVVDGLYKNMYPITMPLQSPTLATDSEGVVTETMDDHYTGFHSLGGLYDKNLPELEKMRKSGLETEHNLADWPDNSLDQMRRLTEDPYADSLYFHSTKLSFLLTGITIPDISEKASNHRGVVRMLIIRPRIPSVKTRWSGTSGTPYINMAYPPHFDTDLFYTKTKTLGGRMDTAVLTNSTVGTNNRYSHLSPTFGLKKYGDVDPDINQVVLNPTSTAASATVTNNVPHTQLHYGHPKPSEGTSHTLSSYDVLTAPINREKYAVVVDKMVTLDTLHHGVASKRIENVVIPYNKKIKFPGRKITSVDHTDFGKVLSDDLEDEPVNFQSRPIIMFLSMDQKISAQVTGYTTISEC